MYPEDEDLRNALRREPPPAGFAARVLNEADRLGPGRRSRGRSRLKAVMVAAAAALAISTAAGSLLYQEQVRRREGERAKEALLVGLRLTGEKLRSAQAQVQHVEAKRIEIQE
jgi:hypothetical protein